MAEESQGYSDGFIFLWPEHWYDFYWEVMPHDVTRIEREEIERMNAWYERG